MHDPTQPSDDSQRIVSRRQALATLGTLAGGSVVAGVTLTSMQRAGASVSVEDFQVSDATFEAQSVTPIVDATIAYDYTVEQASEIYVELQAGGEQIASETLRTSSAELSNTTELTGNILDSPAFGASDFTVASGETTTIDVDVGVLFEVRYDGNVVASDTASDTASVEVVSPESGGYATVGGSVSFRDGSE